jgi:Cu(I)/Ag(I) efflux system membrane fusion protein/cobalt-zinc-cadmium efflux system membrane fusion protein
MDLTPMKAGAGQAGAASGGTVTVDPVMVQNMGLRVAPVRKETLSRKVRTIGEVVVAEDRVSVINLKVAGWIEKLHVDRTGDRVRRGQPLFSVYSPELVAAQEEYLLAQRTAGKDSPLARSARTRLAFLDLGPEAIRALERRGRVPRSFTVRAPRSGHLLHKTVLQGSRVNAGQDLMRIGRLDAIWVQAQVYEWDAPWVRTGQPASMELSFEQGRQYQGRVSYIYPTLNPRTRTLTVRLEFEHPGLQLRPGMFTTVRIQTRRREGALALPTEAIIRSGERSLVFVAQDQPGKYAPRKVVTGLAGDGGLTEVVSGLEQGERVVISGQFLLDSESQLQEATRKLLSRRLQVKGGGGDRKKEQEPGWQCPLHPSIRQHEPGPCPACGTEMEAVKREGHSH